MSIQGLHFRRFTLCHFTIYCLSDMGFMHVLTHDSRYREHLQICVLSLPVLRSAPVHKTSVTRDCALDCGRDCATRVSESTENDTGQAVRERPENTHVIR